MSFLNSSFSLCNLRFEYALLEKRTAAVVSADNLKPLVRDHCLVSLREFWRTLNIALTSFPLIKIIYSSAYRRAFLGLSIFLIMSLMATRNKLGLRIEPCGMPFSRVVKGE